MVLFVKILFFLIVLLPLTSEAAPVQLLSSQHLRQLHDVRIIDARPLAQWQKGHISGALHFDWQNSTATDDNGVAYRRLVNEELAAKLGQLGIDEQATVVIYGDADSSWGGEGWICWLLRTIGHAGPVYLLDGGIQAWQQQGGELSTGIPANIAPAVYQVNEQSDLGIKTADLLQNKSLQLVDTRSFVEWLRDAIPGAVRINWTAFYKGSEHHPLNRGELIKMLQGYGVDPEKPVVYYCTGGVRSAFAWTVHELAGLRTAQNYEGGIAAWRKLR